MTYVFQFSRLVYGQWRSNPAMAIASLIINAYKRLSVLTPQNADVAQTTVGVNTCDQRKCGNRRMCFICSPQTHLCIAKKPRDLHIIVLSKPNAYFCGMRSWPSQNNEIQNLHFWVVRKYVLVNA